MYTCTHAWLKHPTILRRLNNQKQFVPSLWLSWKRPVMSIIVNFFSGFPLRTDLYCNDHWDIEYVGKPLEGRGVNSVNQSEDVFVSWHCFLRGIVWANLYPPTRMSWAHQKGDYFLPIRCRILNGKLINASSRRRKLPTSACTATAGSASVNLEVKLSTLSTVHARGSGRKRNLLLPRSSATDTYMLKNYRSTSRTPFCSHYDIPAVRPLCSGTINKFINCRRWSHVFICHFAIPVFSWTV